MSVIVEPNDLQKMLQGAALDPEAQARQERLERRKFSYQVWMVDGQILNSDHLMISNGGIAIADQDPTTDEYDENGSHVFYPFTQILRINAKWWIPEPEPTTLEEVRGRYL